MHIVNLVNPVDLTYPVWLVWEGISKLDLDGKEHMGLKG